MAQTKRIGKVATKVYRGEIDEVWYHDTCVVQVDNVNGTIRLYHGGWHTVTTQTRMNQAANQWNLPYRVTREDGLLHVTTAFDKYYIPAEGITFNREGEEV